MKKLLKLLTVGVGAGLGLAIGFGLRSGAEYRGPHHGTLGKMGSAESGRRDKAAKLADDSPLATKLEQDLAISTGVRKWLLWLEAVEKATPADFPRLARLAQGKPMALQFLGARWVEVAPRHLYDTLVAALKSGNSNFPVRELGQILFDQWPKKDPEAAIATLSEPGDVGMRDQWRWSVADAVIGIDAERGLKLMADWHIENFGPRMGAINKWAATGPQHAAEFTMANGLGYAAQETMEAIGKEWAKSDPPAALAFAQSHPGRLGSTLAAATMKQWASADLEKAGEWLANADVSTLNRLSPALVETWAKQDANAALNWCFENLNGSALPQAVRGVIGGVAAKDVERAAALVAGMEPSAARAEAAISVAHAWVPFESDKQISPETVNWLTGLDNDSCRRALGEVAWSWATSDPKTMAAFIARSSPDRIPEFADSVLARQMVRKNPLEVFDWANQLPGARGVNAGASGFAEWRSAQPESAMNWFNALAPDDQRRVPFFRSAIETLAWNPQAAEQLAAMNETDRSAARGVIESLNMPDDRRERLLQALNGK